MAEPNFIAYNGHNVWNISTLIKWSKNNKNLKIK